MILLSKSMNNLDWDWSDGRDVAEEEAAISPSHHDKPSTTTPSPPVGWRSSLFGDIFGRRKSHNGDEQEDRPLQEQRQQQQRRRQRAKSVDTRHRHTIRQPTPKNNINYINSDATDDKAPIRRLTLSSSHPTYKRSHTDPTAPLDNEDDGSVISELTMMTYSAEEARLARSIMMSALQGGASNILLEQLSPEQRRAIRQEVHLEKEQQEEAKRQQIRNRNEQNEVFKRLSQMRLQKQIEDECLDRHRRSCSTTDSPDAAGGTSLNGAPSMLDDHQDEVVEDDAQDSMMETLTKELRPKKPQKMKDVSPESGGHRRGGSWGGFSFTSTRTQKHSNANPAVSSENEGGGDSGEDGQDSSIICDWTSSSSKGGESTQSDVQEEEEEEEANDEELPSSSTVGVNEPGIDEIIKLKLLLADQQATIDTLKSKSHKVEQTNHQLQDTNKEHQSQIKTLTTENQDLACQLNDSKKKEGNLRKELSTNIKNSPFFKKLKAENQKLAAYVNEIQQREIDLRKECSIMLKHVSSITSKSAADSSPTPSGANAPTPRSPEFDDHDNEMEQAEVKSLGRAASFGWY